MPGPAPAPRAAAERTLRLALLALQKDLVSNEALVRALRAWLANPARPLEDILVEQGARDEDARALLATLPDVPPGLNDNGVTQAPPSNPSACAPRQPSPATVDAAFPFLLTTLCGGAVAPAPALPSGGERTAAGLRFHILRPHARGGLGQVSVARDEELGREVALKEMQAPHADDPASRSRFVREAAVTGHLEHPGVVPVYGLGQYADGRPFYAMRFIKGDSLKDAIARFHQAEAPGREMGERALALRQLLGRFVAVCNAVAFAHSRGVIHRDLKADNVMLGAYGETLVVDWGLAKVLGRPEDPAGPAPLPPLPGEADAAATQAGAVLGTPAFMPPEQALGELDRLGPASDVYSLGAMLYHLLTGRAPFAGTDALALLLKVAEGDFPPPRRVKSTVPAALEAICLKAMARRPEDRYGSAQALADDVEHWLADEPVGAWREPLRVRLGRWARRHKAAVTAAAAALVVALLAGGAGLWWLEQQQAEARQAVETALTEVGRLQREARWGEARAVLAQAQDRLGDGGPSDLQDRLDRTRRELDLVARLDAIRLKRATIVNWKPDFAGADRDYAAAFAEAGLGRVGQDPATVARRVADTEVRAALVAALDDWVACAQEETRRAWVLGVARRADPDPWRDRLRDPAVWRDTAALVRLINTVPAERLTAPLLAALGGRAGPAGTQLMRQGQTRHPGDFWLNFILANALVEKGAPEEAVGYYRAALAARPGTLAIHNNLGNAFATRGRLDEAVAEFRRVIARDPRHALAHVNLALALGQQGHRDEAIACYRRAIALDPRITAAHYNLGLALRNQGRLDEAVACYRRAVALDPNFADAHLNLGVALHDQRQVEEAIASYRRAIALDPKLAYAHNNLGNALKDRGLPEQATACYRRAIELDAKYVNAHVGLGNALADLGRKNEAITAYRRALAFDPKHASAHYGLGNAFLALGQLDEAVACFRRTIVLTPRDAQAHNNLGVALRDQGQAEEAVACFRRALEIDPKLVQAHTNLGDAFKTRGQLEEAIACYRRAIEADPKYAQAHSHLGVALADKGQVQQAIACYRRAIALAPKLAGAHNNLGNALKAQGQLDEAIACYRRSLALNPKLAPVHNNLGSALQVKGRLDEAIACYRRAAELDPKSALAPCNLGNALKDKGQMDDAIACYRQAIARDPKFAIAHHNLGSALRHKGRVEEAVACYRQVVALLPRDVLGRTDLGLALAAAGRLDEALAECRKAVLLDATNGQAQGGLGSVLLANGQFTEARQALRRAGELLPSVHPFRKPLAAWLRQCDQLMPLDATLTAVLRGKARPANTTERLALAQLCAHWKRLYGTAARFYDEAFTAEPKLAEDAQAGHRYTAASAAALAAGGRGADAGQLDERERSRWRRQAVAWLRAELAARARQADGGKAADRAQVRRALLHWQKDPSLAGVRDAAILDKLPEAERAACRQLWADVADLLKKAGGSGKP